MPNDAAPPAVKVAQLPAVHDSGEFSLLLDSGKFAQLQRIGTMYARSKMVPAHFQGDEPSCMVAVQMAMRLNIDPFMFLQKTYVVGGKPGMEAPLVIALINTRGPFKGPVNWDLKRDDKGDVVECTAYATHRETGTVCSSTVTWKMVEAEGWSKKNGSKWLTLREQMFKYRSAAFLGRLYCPEVLMGMSTNDELHDEIDVTPEGENQPLAQPRTLKDRIVKRHTIDAGTQTATDPHPENPSTEQLVDSGHIVIHEDAAAGASQGAPATSGGAEVAQGSAAGSSEPQRGPAMDFEAILRLAKKAKSPDQSDIVLDALNDPAYTPEQRQAVKDILKSKEYAK